MKNLSEGFPIAPVLALGLLVAAGARAQEPAPGGPPTPMPGAGIAPVTPAPAVSFVPVRVIQMRPTEKRPLALKEDERNPYAKRNPQSEVVSAQEGDAEELRIRQRISMLRVSGRSMGPNGLRVLLGDIILEKGRVLPQLLEDQSEILQVLELSEDAAVLGWIDRETNQVTGKTIQVSYDLAPSVSYALQGQAGEERGEGEAAPRMGVIRVNDDRKAREADMAARGSGNGIPPEVFKAGQ
jgi:hypothetical protein